MVQSYIVILYERAITLANHLTDQIHVRFLLDESCPWWVLLLLLIPALTGTGWWRTWTWDGGRWRKSRWTKGWGEDRGGKRGLARRVLVTSQNTEGLVSDRLDQAVVATTMGYHARRSCTCPPEGLFWSGYKKNHRLTSLIMIVHYLICMGTTIRE